MTYEFQMSNTELQKLAFALLSFSLALVWYVHPTLPFLSLE